MNCLWIILLLSCFGGCCNSCTGCGDGCGCDNNRCGNHNRCGSHGCCGHDSCCDGDRRRNRCRHAVEKAVDECGSEKAVMKALKEREHDCGCSKEKPDCAEAREERAERRAERAERMADNSCGVSGMMPPHWKDFPEVSRPSSHDDCGCNG